MDKKDHIEKFVKKALDWKLWVEKADELIEVAALIKPHIDQNAWNKTQGKVRLEYYPIYFMLMSYALENLLKALKVKKNSHLKGKLGQTRRLPKELVTHDIYSLAKDSGLLSLDDYPDITEALLKRMCISATWFSRYPTPVKATDMNSSFYLENADYYGMLRSYGSEDVSQIDKIIASVYAKLGKQAPKSPNSPTNEHIGNPKSSENPSSLGRHGSKLDELNIGLTKSLYLLNQNLSLYKIIGLNANFLKKERWCETLFFHIEKLALDSFVVDICKIYERGGTYELNTIPQILDHLEKQQLEPIDSKPVDSFIQKYEEKPSNTDVIINRLKNILDTFCNNNKSHFTSLKDARDKIIAHTEFGFYKDRLPSYDIMERLLLFGIDFYSMIHKGYIGGSPVDHKNDKRIFRAMCKLLKNLGLGEIKQNFKEDVS